MSKIENALNDFGEQLVNSLKVGLQSAKPGSESLTEAIQSNVLATNTGFTLQLSVPASYRWIDEGRAPGKFPPPQAITGWLNKNRIQVYSKRINAGKGKTLSPGVQTKSLAYLIGRKIARDGIPATDFYSSVVNKTTLSQLSNQLSEAFKQDCLNQLN